MTPLHALLLCALPLAGPPADAPTRTFHFTYAAVAAGLEPGEPVRVWLPLAASDADQEVAIVSKDLPAEGKIGRDAEYGNEILYVEARADEGGTSR